MRIPQLVGVGRVCLGLQRRPEILIPRAEAPLLGNSGKGVGPHAQRSGPRPGLQLGPFSSEKLAQSWARGWALLPRVPCVDLTRAETGSLFSCCAWTGRFNSSRLAGASCARRLTACRSQGLTNAARPGLACVQDGIPSSHDGAQMRPRPVFPLIHDPSLVSFALLFPLSAVKLY